MAEDLLFVLKEITYSPKAPRMKEPFTVKGKVQLFNIPFVAPIWVIARVTYPEKWWEAVIPIIGSPTVAEGDIALGSDFEVGFPKGFDREGEFTLEVAAYAGPTFSVDKITLPPFPPVSSEKTTFIVGGEVPPEEVGFQNFRIVSYRKNGGTPVTPPGVLELKTGDRLTINLGYDHRGLAVTGKVHAAIWQGTALDPHDEVLFSEKAFSVPAGGESFAPLTASIDIAITSAISSGSYGLYAKIMGITGGDIFTEYLKNVITIAGAPPEEADIRNFDFTLARGTYAVGANVPFAAPYEYKGIGQDGQLTISIGTGAYPTFNPVHSYSPTPVKLAAAADWQARRLEGSITLPAVLQPGQTYNVRTTLETLTKRTQETDTDWSAFTIAAAPEAPAYVGFRMEVNQDAVGRVYPGANRWTVFYFDPGLGKFVGDSQWHFLSTRVNFDAIVPGGYLSVFVYNDNTGSTPSEYHSQAWIAQDAHTYEVNIETGQVVDIS